MLFSDNVSRYSRFSEEWADEIGQKTAHILQPMTTDSELAMITNTDENENVPDRWDDGRTDLRTD